MFKLQPAAAQTILPAGSKRPYSETATSASKLSVHSATAAAVVSQSRRPQAAGQDDNACFQLLHVRGIPDWANRYNCCPTLSLARLCHTLSYQHQSTPWDVVKGVTSD